MNLAARIKSLFVREQQPEHLRRGELGERVAEKHLRGLGLKFLTRNFRSERGEIDLVFRDGDCLLFVSFRRYFRMLVYKGLHHTSKSYFWVLARRAGKPIQHRSIIPLVLRNVLHPVLLPR